MKIMSKTNKFHLNTQQIYEEQNLSKIKKNSVK